MPIAVVATLQPVAAAQVPTMLARAAHAALLREVAAQDAGLAARLHDAEGPRPFTVSNVIGLPRAGGELVRVDPTCVCRLRVTLLEPELERLAGQWCAEPPPLLDLDGSLWQVRQMTQAEAVDGWAGAQGYADLMAPVVQRTKTLPTRWTLEFASPVTFRQQGRNQPLPLPELVFGSLLERWNAFAPLALPDEVRRFAAECLAVSRFELQSVRGTTKNRAFQVGAVGQMTYVATVKDRYWLACLETLAQFAFFSGVGAGTARGYGQTRILG
jgi:CRISPR-associated endoribonuclease Cas6